MSASLAPPVLRVIVREVVNGHVPLEAGRLRFREVAIGDDISIGRGCELAVGASPEDSGISRTALTVSGADDGWHLHVANLNGAAVHRWAQNSTWVAAGTRLSLRWPRVGIRLAGNRRDLEHWVLLEADGYTMPSWSPSAALATDTQARPRPRDITLTQLAAIHAIFASHLAWPPVSAPIPRSLDSVANRLGVTPSAIRERLKPVQERAHELGLHRQVSVTEPDYVFHLAAHGYLNDVPPSVLGPLLG